MLHLVLRESLGRPRGAEASHLKPCKAAASQSSVTAASSIPSVAIVPVQAPGGQ
jgi:hypothetical protein